MPRPTSRDPPDCAPAVPWEIEDHNTLPLSGTLFGLLGGMVGQDGGATGDSNPDVVIASAVGDDGGDIKATLFSPDFLGSLFTTTQ